MQNYQHYIASFNAKLSFMVRALSSAHKTGPVARPRIKTWNSSWPRTPFT
jgi:hypothetical protein